MTSEPSRGLADRSLFGTIGRLVPVTLGAQAAGFVFSVALARVLGSSTETDAFFLALTVPAGIYGLMFAGLRQGAMPAMTDSLARSDDEFARDGSQLVSSATVTSAVLAVVVTGLALLAVPLVLADASPRLVALVRTDLVALAPLPVLGAVTGTLATIQTVRGHVASAVGVLAFEPLAKAASVVTLGPSLGAPVLIIGQLAGTGLAAVVLWAMIRRDGVDLRLVPTVVPPFARDVMRLSLPLIISQSVLQANPIVDRLMATPLGPGSVTQLELGTRMFYSAIALLTGSLVTPLTGTWSARLLHDGWEVVRAGVIRAVVAVLVIVPPIVTLGIALRHQAMDLLFGGGAYSAHALQVTADVLGMLVIGLPAVVLVVVFASLFVVQRSTVFPMLVGITNVFLNVILNFAFRPGLGVAGLALSSSVTVTLLVVVYARSATRRWQLGLREAVPSAVRAVVSGVVLGGAAFLLTGVTWGESRAAILAEVVVVVTAVLILHAAVLLVAREPLALRALARIRPRLTRGVPVEPV